MPAPEVRQVLRSVLDPDLGIDLVTLGLLAATSILLLGGAAGSLVEPTWGARVTGAGLVATGAWLMLRAPAWRGLAQAGPSRLAGLAMLAGQAWLIIAGGLATAQAPLYAGAAYDGVLQPVFLGFAMSMVFAHAPTMVPVFTGLAVRAHRGLYLPLEGRYSVDDVRMALREARDKRVRTHALAVDEVARSTLPRMMGPGCWDILPHPDRLAEALTRAWGHCT